MNLVRDLPSAILIALFFCFSISTARGSEAHKHSDDEAHDHDEEKSEKKGHAHAKGEENHEHGKDEKNHGHVKGEKEHDHGKNEKDHGHDHGKEEKDHGQGHGEEGSAATGPDKGVLEKGPLGLRFSEEALRTIAASSIEFKGGDALTLPSDALVKIKDTKSVIRVRDGWHGRVAAEVVSRTADTVTVRARGLKAGDRVISSKAGFFRIAELLVEEGASHSHSH